MREQGTDQRTQPLLRLLSYLYRLETGDFLRTEFQSPGIRRAILGHVKSWRGDYCLLVIVLTGKAGKKSGSDERSQAKTILKKESGKSCCLWQMITCKHVMTYRKNKTGY